VNLEIKEWVYDAGHLKGKVILWVESGDISCFIV